MLFRKKLRYKWHISVQNKAKAVIIGRAKIQFYFMIYQKVNLHINRFLMNLHKTSCLFSFLLFKCIYIHCQYAFCITINN